MADARPFLPAAPALGDDQEVHGRFRNARLPPARPNPRGGGGTAQRSGGLSGFRSHRALIAQRATKQSGGAADAYVAPNCFASLAMTSFNSLGPIEVLVSGSVQCSRQMALSLPRNLSASACASRLVANEYRDLSRTLSFS